MSMHSLSLTPSLSLSPSPSFPLVTLLSSTLSLTLSTTAEAPGHFLPDTSAAPHHYQPHWPLPPSERSDNTQAFTRATYHPGYAVGAALALQSIKIQEPASVFIAHPTHNPSLFFPSTLPLPTFKDWGHQPPFECQSELILGHACGNGKRQPFWTSWDNYWIVRFFCLFVFLHLAPRVWCILVIS